MSTNDVLITPGSGEVKWVDSGGSDFVRIIGDAGATNTITFVGDDNTANGVIFQDHATDVFYPATSGLNLGVSANRWNLFATAGDFSGAITTATNITLSGASSLLAINGASATISMGGTAGLFTFSGGSSILLSGANSSITLTGLSSVLTLAGVTGTNLAPLKFTTGSAPGTSVAGQMWWTGSSNLQFAKTNGTASTFAFTDTDLSTFTVGILGVARGGTGTGTTFTLGSVVFAGASGVYTQDNANFFWDDTNNRLGIGTASPTSDLSLGGATAARTIGLERKTSGAGSNLTIRSGGAQSGATDTAGGTLILSSGITTGQGFSYVDIYTYGDETVITGSSDNSSMPVARFGGAGIALGTTTIGSGLNLTLNSNVGVTPWTYAIGLPDSTSVGGNALTIKSGNATTASNISGGTLALVAGNATGTGSSSITFSTATAGTTGTTVRTSSTKITISGTAMSLSPHGTSAGNTYEFQFLELAANGTNYLSFKSPDSIGTTITHTLPADVPAAGEFLKITSYSGGAAVLEWAPGASIGATITSGTTGSVLFVGGSTDIQQDNANLFWDDTNNTLGVGTTRTGAISGTNPRLRVLGSGATSATSSFEVQNSSATSLFFVRNDGLINFGTKGTYTESSGRLALSTSGSGAGILLGGDFPLYRQAAAVGRIDGALWVNGRITISEDPATYPNSALRITKYPGSDAQHLAGNFLVWNTSNYTRTQNTIGVLCDHYYGATSNCSAGLYGGLFNMVVQAAKNTGTISNVFGGRFSGTWSATTSATGDEIGAAQFVFSSSSATANLTNGYGIKIATSMTSGFSITRLYSIYAIGPTAATGTITSYNGVYIASPTSATITTHCGVYIEDLGIGTNRYAIYLAGTSGTARQGITWNGDVNLYRSAADVLKTDDSLNVARAISSGVVTLSDGATPALDASLGNTFLLTAAGDRTIAVPSNPTSGQKITIVHKASGGARTLSLNTGAGGFRFGTDITALTSTTSGLTDYIGAIYNAADSKWDIVSYVKGFA